MEKLSGIIGNSGRQVLDFQEIDRPKRISDPTPGDQSRILRPPPEPIELPTADRTGFVKRGSMLDIRG